MANFYDMDSGRALLSWPDHQVFDPGELSPADYPAQVQGHDGHTYLVNPDWPRDDEGALIGAVIYDETAGALRPMTQAEMWARQPGIEELLAPE